MKPRILLVEDEVVVRDHLAEALSDEFLIETAENGEAALRAVLRGRPDLVVTDLVMPGMDGVVLVKTLRDTPSTSTIPILMISGKAPEELRLQGFELGADAYLGKPYTEKALRVRIHALLQSVRIRTELARAQERDRVSRAADAERSILLESISEAFCAVDRDWQVTFANQRALSLLAMSKEALLGQIIWDVFPQLKGTLAQREAERALREQTSASVEFESPVTGRCLELHAYPSQQGLAVHFRDITERKRADSRLRESERRLRLMSDSIPALVSYMDTQCRYQFCNRRYEEWFGIASEQIVGRTMQDVLGEAAFSTLKPAVDRALAGETISFEKRVPYRTGGTRDVHIDYAPEIDDTGRVLGFYALVQDITARKRAEQLTVESEARFRSLADNAPVMVWVTEADGSCSFLSRSWYEFTGQTEETGLGSGWLSAVHPDDAARAGAKFADANAAREAFRLEYRLRRADGTYRWAIDAASPRLSEEGHFLGFVGSVMDIQDRREIEEQLRALNERLEQRVEDVDAERKLFADLVEGTDAFVQVADLNFRWLAVNRASADEFEAIFGKRPKVGESMLELLADQPESQAAVKAVWARALAGEQFSEVREYGDPERKRRFYEMKFNSLRDRDGNLVGAYQFSYDVTARIKDQASLAQTQEALRQSQKMETLGQLTGGVAHDFNNLLTPIVGVLDLVLRKYENDSRTQKLTAGALQAAERAKTLIQRLLAFARRQHLQARAVNIEQLLEGVRDLFARTLGPRIALSIEIDPALPPAAVDPNQLELALLNLAVNGRDAMPEGGSLTIRASEAIDAHVRQLLPGRYLQICVQDTGIGMTPEVLNRAIEPFFTTKNVGQGTGLGLSMVHGLAAQSGGDLRLESTPGQGTTATLWLPIADSVPIEDANASTQSTLSQSPTSTVLLVDDEPLVREGTAAMLSEGGYRVVEAASADEAFRLMRDGLTIDVLITDFAMPGRTGAQLAHELRKQQPNLPILLITGFASLTDGEAGGLPRLAKPFRQHELLSSIEEAVHAAKPPASA